MLGLGGKGFACKEIYPCLCWFLWIGRISMSRQSTLCPFCLLFAERQFPITLQNWTSIGLFSCVPSAWQWTALFQTFSNIVSFWSLRLHLKIMKTRAKKYPVTPVISPATLHGWRSLTVVTASVTILEAGKKAENIAPTETATQLKSVQMRSSWV